MPSDGGDRFIHEGLRILTNAAAKLKHQFVRRKF